ncbi:hypothetical protein B7R87_26400 [Streptomyces tsukubensis]|nr:hypothetical protein B7R87_26400 [Streptomyces tsukubensis]
MRDGDGGARAEGARRGNNSPAGRSTATASPLFGRAGLCPRARVDAICFRHPAAEPPACAGRARTPAAPLSGGADPAVPAVLWCRVAGSGSFGGSRRAERFRSQTIAFRSPVRVPWRLRGPFAGFAPLTFRGVPCLVEGESVDWSAVRCPPARDTVDEGSERGGGGAAG